jgi:hypothetical protein
VRKESPQEFLERIKNIPYYNYSRDNEKWRTHSFETWRIASKFNSAIERGWERYLQTANREEKIMDEKSRARKERIQERNIRMNMCIYPNREGLEEMLVDNLTENIDNIKIKYIGNTRSDGSTSFWHEVLGIPSGTLYLVIGSPPKELETSLCLE